MNYVFVIVLSYLIGNINPAIIVSKRTKGIDIRKINSKNAGTSNVTMSIGYRWGIFVGIMDILKGIVPVVIVRMIYPTMDVMWFLSGFSVIMGHIFPYYYNFKGGKGTATFGGVLIATMPLFAAVMFFVFFLILYITDYIALSTLAAIIITPIVMMYYHFDIVSIGVMSLFSLVSFYKHLENYKRIIARREVGIRKFNRNKDRIRVKEAEKK